MYSEITVILLYLHCTLVIVPHFLTAVNRICSRKEKMVIQESPHNSSTSYNSPRLYFVFLAAGSTAVPCPLAFPPRGLPPAPPVVAGWTWPTPADSAPVWWGGELPSSSCRSWFTSVDRLLFRGDDSPPGLTGVGSLSAPPP